MLCVYPLTTSTHFPPLLFALQRWKKIRCRSFRYDILKRFVNHQTLAILCGHNWLVRPNGKTLFILPDHGYFESAICLRRRAMCDRVLLSSLYRYSIKTYNIIQYNKIQFVRTSKTNPKSCLSFLQFLDSLVDHSLVRNDMCEVKKWDNSSSDAINLNTL